MTKQTCKFWFCYKPAILSTAVWLQSMCQWLINNPWLGELLQKQISQKYIVIIFLKNIWNCIDVLGALFNLLHIVTGRMPNFSHNVLISYSFFIQSVLYTELNMFVPLSIIYLIIFFSRKLIFKDTFSFLYTYQPNTGLFQIQQQKCRKIMTMTPAEAKTLR